MLPPGGSGSVGRRFVSGWWHSEGAVQGGSGGAWRRQVRRSHCATGAGERVGGVREWASGLQRGRAGGRPGDWAGGWGWAGGWQEGLSSAVLQPPSGL
jgi:hypothetical protein